MVAEKQAHQVKMDAAQLEAIQELKEKFEYWDQDELELDYATHGMGLIADWMDRWYRRAGYKRLAKILIEINREGPVILDTPELIIGE